MCMSPMAKLLSSYPFPVLSPPIQDTEGAMSPSEISNALGLSALKNRTWAIFKTSALKGEGLEEAMEWSVSTSLENLYQPKLTKFMTLFLSLLGW